MAASCNVRVLDFVDNRTPVKHNSTRVGDRKDVLKSGMVSWKKRMTR